MSRAEPGVLPRARVRARIGRRRVASRAMTPRSPMSKRASRAGNGNRDRPRLPGTVPARVLIPSTDFLWMAALIVGAVLMAYGPALDGRFLWDDDAHVTRPDLRSLSGLWRIWFDLRATQQYYPFLHSAFWLEQRLWGDAVVGYHLVNVVLHAASACLLLGVLRRLQIPGAPLAAAIFALHPVHVESVAWITEQKNTLSLAFYLVALLLYLRFDEGRRLAMYVLASGLFVLGLLTKTVVATLPGALLVIFWWQRGRLSWRRDVLPLVPWLGAGSVAGLLTARIERGLLGAEGADFTFTLWERSLLAGRVIWFYLGKLVWPVDLMFVYPRWPVGASTWPQGLFLLGTLTVLAAFWTIRRRSRAPLAVSLFFIGSLFPVLGFLNVYPFVFSFVADHFQYIPSLGIIAATAALLTTLWERGGARVRGLGLGLCLALLGALGVLSWRQSRLYRDPRTLYAETLARNPACYLCLNNLATLSVEAGRLDEAAEQYGQALRIKPDSAEAHSNLGNLLLKSGSVGAAIDHYEQALRAAPKNVIARTNLGIALFVSGRLPEARAQFEEALRILPGYAPAQKLLSELEAAPRTPLPKR
jgi:protein O-mannosyl-transferase